VIRRSVLVWLALLLAYARIGHAQTPSITLDATAAPAGGPITAVIDGGPGNAGDFAGLYDADGNAMQWLYLNGTQSLAASGATGASITFMLPTKPGTYHACFFDASYRLIATSGSVTTTASSITLGATTGNPGVQVSAIVANAPGWTGDWAGLYDADGNNIEWQYLDGLHTPPASSIRDTTLTFTTPLTPGVYHARLFNAAYVEVAASGTITTENPRIMLGATTGTAGGQVTATIVNAPGLPGDFAGLYDANGVNLQWQYLDGTQTLPPAGRTSATLGFWLPGTPGVYHARLFKGDYTQVATSATISTFAPSVALSTTTGTAGGPVTAIVTNGPGGRGDWVGLYDQTGTDFGWMYLNGSHEMPDAGVTSAAVTFMLPVSPGAFSVRLSNGQYVSLAASGTITTMPPAVVPTISLDTTTAAVGGTITASVAHAPGWPGDFVALYDADDRIVQWQYLNGSLTPPAAALHDAALTFSLPATPGSYRARLLNALFEVVASSGTLTATAPSITSESSINHHTGTTLTVTIRNAPGTPFDWAGVYNAAGTLVQWQHLNGSHTAPSAGLTSATLSFTLPPTPYFYFDIPSDWLGSASIVQAPTFSIYTVKLFNGTNRWVGTSDTATVAPACPSAAVLSTPPLPHRLRMLSQCLRPSKAPFTLSRCLCQ